MQKIGKGEWPEWYKEFMKTAPKVGTPAPSQVLSKQTSITAITVPMLKPSQKNAFQLRYAMYVYATATSFNRVENKYLKEAIKMLRPGDNILPTRKQLATTLLHKCYNELRERVEKQLRGKTVCMTNDSWSNVKNDPIMNFMAASPACTLFLESVATGVQAHTHKYIADEITRIFNSYNTTFAGAVTDNTSTNKAAWCLLHKRHPSCFFQGCASHGLHLLVKDIFAATKTTRAGQQEPTYPDGYPFEDLHNFVDACKEIVTFFHNHQIPKALLNELQLETKALMLVSPAPTRWGSIQAMFKSILVSVRLLRMLVMDDDFFAVPLAQKAKRLQLCQLIIDTNFISKLRKAIAILRPIDALIVKYQDDKVPISAVRKDFLELPSRFQVLQTAGAITLQEKEYLSKVALNRYDFMRGIGHELAYLLDPILLGEGMTPEENHSVRNLLFKIPTDDANLIDPELRRRLHRQYYDYMERALAAKNNTEYEYERLVEGDQTPLGWWKVNGRDYPDLAKIAVKLFSMAASSAASERNFSTMAFIHSKLRNRLKPETVEMLVYIKSNLAALEYQPAAVDEMLEDIYSGTSSSEGDDDVDYYVSD
jgi:hypothetical protein